MLKITEKEKTRSSITLNLEGRIAEDLIEAVKEVCEPILLSGLRLQIDMADVSFVDRSGVSYFLGLQNRKVNLINCSLFLSEQLIKRGENHAANLK